MVTVRIHDRTHDNRYSDRFNQRLLVQPGYNHFSLSTDNIARAPDRRVMDLTDIEAIGWFITRPKKNHSLYIDNIGLN